MAGTKNKRRTENFGVTRAKSSVVEAQDRKFHGYRVNISFDLSSSLILLSLSKNKRRDGRVLKGCCCCSSPMMSYCWSSPRVAVVRRLKPSNGRCCCCSLRAYLSRAPASCLPSDPLWWHGATAAGSSSSAWVLLHGMAAARVLLLHSVAPAWHGGGTGPPPLRRGGGVGPPSPRRGSSIARWWHESSSMTRHLHGSGLRSEPCGSRSGLDFF
jgi:hypothetical protein